MASKKQIKIGIIGGTGLDKPEILQHSHVKDVDTPFGKPASSLVCGDIHDVPVVILSRHGREHAYQPSDIPHRANIYALKQEGCTHIIVSNACGSLQENYAPGQIAITDQFIDRTTRRSSTFYDSSCDEFKGVCHIPMRHPFSPDLSKIAIDACNKLKYEFHPTATIMAIEGPRYSTFAEAKLFQMWGAHIIGMTTSPEVVLANELGIPYCSIATITDYDCWREHEGNEHVDTTLVVERMKSMSTKFVKIVIEMIDNIKRVDWSKVLEKHSEVARKAVM